MSPVLSADDEQVNWLNYKTGEKNIYFRMQADNKNASIAIELTHKDVGLQALYFEQFQQLRSLLHDALQEEWIWRLHTQDEHGKTVSKIYIEKENVNIFRQEDWPEIISFFKPRIISLDAFWSNTKHIFEAMR